MLPWLLTVLQCVFGVHDWHGLACNDTPETEVIQSVGGTIKGHTPVSYTHLTLPTIYSV